VHIQPANKFNIDIDEKENSSIQTIRQFVQRNEGRIYRDKQERKCRLVLSITNHYSSLAYTDSKAMTGNKIS
jgi:cob(I)alamin adenosyltransferase